MNKRPRVLDDPEYRRMVAALDRHNQALLDGLHEAIALLGEEQAVADLTARIAREDPLYHVDPNVAGVNALRLARVLLLVHRERRHRKRGWRWTRP